MHLRAQLNSTHPPGAQLSLVVEVWGAAGLLGATPELLGSAHVPLAELGEAEAAHVAVELRRAGRCVAVLQRGREPPPRKTLFFFRHGQSVWNRAQKELDVLAMVSGVDHPLNGAGRLQAEGLRAELARLVAIAEAEGGKRAGATRARRPRLPACLRACGRVRPAGAPDGLSALERELLGVQLIASSPLTRASQTALIGLGPLLAHTGRPLRLMPNLREKKNLGGLDSSGAAVGAGVIERLAATTRDLYRDAPAAAEAMLAGVRVETREVEGRWWTDIVESKEEVRGRLRELLWQLQFAPEQRIALVGHSHFLRELFRAHLSAAFREADGAQAERLCTQLISNCGLVALELDFSGGEREGAALEQPGAGGVIARVELMLGTTLTGPTTTVKARALTT